MNSSFHNFRLNWITFRCILKHIWSHCSPSREKESRKAANSAELNVAVKYDVVLEQGTDGGEGDLGRCCVCLSLRRVPHRMRGHAWPAIWSSVSSHGNNLWRSFSISSFDHWDQSVNVSSQIRCCFSTFEFYIDLFCIVWTKEMDFWNVQL